MLYQMSYSRTQANGRGRVRTYVGIRRQIYSLLPLTTRAPYQPFKERRSKGRNSEQPESLTRNPLPHIRYMSEIENGEERGI